MAKKKKYYVVWVGNNPGVYDSWTDCQLQIKGYPGAKYKAFPSLAAAEAAYEGNNPSDHFSQKEKKKPIAFTGEWPKEVRRDALAVDAACSGNPGKMEYRGVDVDSGTQMFHQGPYVGGTNNIGEFLALVHGIAWMQQTKQHDRPIYSDSKIAMGWVKKKKARTTIPFNAKTKILHNLIARAEKWLKENTYKNEILKWQTKEWGEIPADFGRK